MKQPTHRIRPHAGDNWEHVNDEQLAAIEKQVGPRTFKAGYAVEKLAEKPAALETTAVKPPRSATTPANDATGAH